MDGYVELTYEKLKTYEGINELNNMLRMLFDHISSDGNKVKVYIGYATPEGAIVAKVGSIFFRKDGGANTTLYVKESGNNTATGWIAK